MVNIILLIVDTQDFNKHIERLKAQTDKLKDTLSAFHSNYTTLQFGMNRLQNELKKSREQFEQMTYQTEMPSAPIIQMKTQDEDDQQLTA